MSLKQAMKRAHEHAMIARHGAERWQEMKAEQRARLAALKSE